ncbi:MAG: hypothetical protein JWM78_2468 [Verrucomicrobiaceae bacterium]|nr:hypothetical protein [Verrucomicrobiaceae bacterium]
MSTTEQQKLSTSALAKLLDIPLQQLFATLRDCGWIRKVEDGWVLTAKGEFEGGEYVHSRRYGRYIVWPDIIVEHQLLRGIESNRMLSATQLARKYQITAREVRRVLGEIGLLQRDFSGWRLTRAGEQVGGVIIESDAGDAEISWPESLLENSLVAEQFEYMQRLYVEAEQPEADLLTAITELRALDGHSFHSRSEWLVCHWLYLAGVAHACNRRLPLVQETPEHHADFWLPQAQVYIEVSGDEHDAGAIAATMERLDLYRKQQWHYIEVRAEHLAHLDEYLTRALRELGVDVF